MPLNVEHQARTISFPKRKGIPSRKETTPGSHHSVGGLVVYKKWKGTFLVAISSKESAWQCRRHRFNHWCGLKHTHTHTHTQNRTCYVKRDMRNKSSNNYLVVSKWKLVEVSFHSCAIKITVSAPGWVLNNRIWMYENKRKGYTGRIKELKVKNELIWRTVNHSCWV